MSSRTFAIDLSSSRSPLRLSAFGTSFLLHCLLALGLIFALQAAPVSTPPLVRLVFMDAPPPPPPAAPVAEAVPPKRPVVVEKTTKKVARRPVPKPAPPVLAPPVLPAEAPPPAETSPPEVAGGAGQGIAGGIPGGTGTAPVPVGQVARPPVLVHRVVPVYPSEARRRGVGGWVRLEAVLDVRGRIEDSIRIVQSIPDLDEAAATALRQWRFAPARDQFGEPVRVVLEVPIRFVLR